MNDSGKFNVEYDIVDTENPENNQVVKPDAPSAEIMETAEQKIQRMAAMLKSQMVMDMIERRGRENARALKARVKQRRAKNKVAKVSRARNRG